MRENTGLVKLETTCGITFLSMFEELWGEDYEWMEGFLKRVCEKHGLEYTKLMMNEGWWAVGMAFHPDELPPHEFDNHNNLILTGDEKE